MKKMTDLSALIAKNTPPEMLDFLRTAGKTAEAEGRRLFVVGGVVRDLLMGRPNLDFDLVVEGNAISLAQKLAETYQGRTIAHTRFTTAKLRWGRWVVDIASTRSESYTRPGALPSVVLHPDIRQDLCRRDFTINAMAVSLAPSDFGQLTDIFHGQEDLSAGLIRILHERSFQDDATRLWRAVRYEQRLGFKIERDTLALLRRDLKYLDTISADRLRNELELCLVEEKPEQALERASYLGLLARISPQWQVAKTAVKNLVRARTRLQPYTPPSELYLAILFYNLNAEALAEIYRRLNFSKSVARILQESYELHGSLDRLRQPSLSKGEIYLFLKDYSQNALLANLLCSDESEVSNRIELYLSDLKNVRTLIKGQELIKAGLASGPQVGKLLEKLKAARLDGQVDSKTAELALAEKLSRTGF
jgi:tRNA nucleotidyltransferase (CCA-adding enzyme)